MAPTATRTVKLEVCGGTAEVRRTNGADVIFLEQAQHERGYEAQGTDAVILAERVTLSYDAPGFASVRDLPETDIIAIYLAAKGADDPNPSAPSSDGTKPKTRREGNPQANG